MARFANEDELTISAARVVYLKMKGRSHRGIYKVMKELGYNFSRRYLYTHRYPTGTLVGWPERFGWDEELKAAGIVVRKRRNGDRNRFEDWLHRTQRVGGMKWSWRFQREIYGKLAEVTSGKCKRLMIFMPPRHGKTELVTQRYVAWRLLEDAGLNVILGSYSQQLASRFSRRAKRVWEEEVSRQESESSRQGERSEPPALAGGQSVGEEASLGNDAPDRHARSHSRFCPDEKPARAAALKKGRRTGRPLTQAVLTRRSNAVAEWETGFGGGVRAVGVGGGIAGFGAGLIVIDDPVRNRQDAESETKRDTLDDWFKSDIYTRLEPDGAIILIQTRWHEDDLAGRLLRQMEEGGDKWDVISLPAIAEEEEDIPSAEAAHSKFHIPDPKADIPEFQEEEESSGTLPSGILESWNMEFGMPNGREPGTALCPERYTIKDLKRIRREIGAYNFAALYQQRPIPLEGGQFKRKWFRQVIDYVPEGLDWKRGYDLAASTKTSADYTASFRVAVDKAGNLYIADGYRAKVEYPEQRRFIVEKMRTEANTEHGIEAALHGKAVVQDLRSDRSVSGALKEVAVTSDKLSRALAWLNLAEAGKVFLIRGPWITAFVDEIASFPKGRHDDQIDAVSTAVSMLLIPGERKYKAGGF